MQHHREHRKWILSFVIVITALSIATPVLAEYLGPNRTREETTSTCKIFLNECQFVADKNEWRYKNVDSWSCSNESKPWQAYPSNARACNDTNYTAGYQYWEREDVTQTQTVTYPPATIYGSLQDCTLQNGWCITPAYLYLGALEPVSGEYIFAIEGTLNGQNFACTAASCGIPLIQGNNTFSFWALSSFEDSSTMGTLTAKMDTQLPTISGALNGTLGTNGWYISPVLFNGLASDATAGLSSFTCTLDGVALGSCNTVTINSDGFHTLVLTARDNAGHARTVTQSASLDTQNPALNASISGALGSNNWYTAANLNASASDPSPGSGLALFEYSLDGGGWMPFPASGTLNLLDGKHKVDLRAIDTAGHIVLASKSFWLDTVAPNLTVDPAGTTGLNNWYTTNPILTAAANDNTSGVDVLEYSLDHGAWKSYTTPLTLEDGIHTISFWAEDAAGKATQIDRTYLVDTRAPQIGGSVSGTPGENGWYISNVTLAGSAFDPMPGSGIEGFTYILDGNGETPYLDPLTLSDGQHTVHLHARDEAGLSHFVEQNIKVDTASPSLKVVTAIPDWIKNQFTLKGTAGDEGSGLSTVEISLDGGQAWQTVSDADSWTYNWNTRENPSGAQQINVRVTDLAGLTTEQTLTAGVDNHAPEFSLPDSWFQWDTVTLDVWDNHSGLSEARVEIADPEGRWPKRVIELDPKQFPLSFKWDRRMGDDSVAERGVYEVEIIASDNLGNTSSQKSSISILLGIFPPGATATSQPYIRANTTLTPIYVATLIPGSTPTPTPTSVSIAEPVATRTQVISVFGATEPTAHVTPTPGVPPTPRVAPTQPGVLDTLQSFFVPNTFEEPSITEITSPDEEQEAQPSTATANSSVLWGAAAAAAISAAAAYAQEEKQKREEEAARKAELEAQKEERRKKIQERQLEKLEVKWAQEKAWEEARKEKLDQNTPLHTDLKIARLEYEEGVANSLKAVPPSKNTQGSTSTSQDRRAERKDELIQAEINSYTAKPQDWKADYDTYMAQKAQEELAKKAQAELAQKEKEASSQPKKKNWWEKAIDWVDDHQTEIALGVGVVAGVAAVVLSGGLALPAVLAISVATAGAGVTMGGMTVALNAYYDRPWHENLLKNVALAGAAAALVSTAGFVLQAVTTGVGSYCAVHQSTCARVEPVFKAVDWAEEKWLSAKLAYQTWRGDASGASETAFELHSEYADGGIPGNAVFKELRDQVTDLGKNAIPVIQKYGDDVIPLLVKHGDEGLQLIQKFGPDGIALLQKYGNDATDLVHLDPDVLDYVMQQGDDAVAALSRWSAKDLQEHGLELALRAKNDAKVLADIKKLTSMGPLDPKNLTKEQKALIDAIAANSTQYADEGQVVLGKWVDNGSGFVQTAQDTGSVHYNPHPDMWTTLGKLGDAKQEEVAWLINKQVVQSGIEKGLPFEYTLNGIPSNKIANEGKAVDAIFAGATDAEIMQILKSDYMPVRMKELQELQKAGYEITFDDVNNSFVVVPK